MSVAKRLLALAFGLCLLLNPIGVEADSIAYKKLQKQSNALYKAGKYQQSLALSHKLLAMAKAEFGEEHTEYAMQNFGIGFNLIKLNRPTEAVPYYQRHLTIKEKVYGGKAAGLQFPLNHLAGLYKKLGKLDQAEQLYKRVRTIQEGFAGRNTSFSARAHGDIASINLKRGKWRKALVGYRHSAGLYTGKIKKNGALRVAVIDELNDQQIRKNKDVFTGLTRALWQLQSMDKKNIAFVTKRRVAEALEAAQWAWRTSAGNALGKMAARLGAGDTALARRVRVLQEKSKQIAQINKQSSELLIAMGDAQRQTPGWTSLNRAYWQISNKLGPKNRALAREINKLNNKARQLQRKLAKMSASEKKQSLQSIYATTTAQVDNLRVQKKQVQLKLDEASKPLDEIKQRIEHQYGYEKRRQRLTVRYLVLEHSAAVMNKEIIADFPGYAELVDPRPLKMAEIQKLLRQDEALLVYQVGKQHSYVFAISRTSSSWSQIDLGAAKLEQIVTKLRAGLDPTGRIRPTRGLSISGDGASVRQSEGLPFDLQVAHDLYKSLVAPVKPVLDGAKHILLVPAGALTSLPFQVLVTKKPQQVLPDYQGYKKASWFIRDHALSVLPTVSSLRALRRFAPKGRAPKLFIGYGDPVLEGLGSGGNRSVSMSGFFDGKLADISQVRRLSPLPDTARELKTIAARLGVSISDIHLGKRATETYVKQAKLSDYRLIHFATHGLLAGDLKGLAEPALVLTPPAKASALDDGLLTASEAAQLDLRADWVVMSACNTASGGKPGAEALSGLARAFFYAGARALLVSHWPVYSQAATELTTSAFAELNNHRDVGRSEALRRAMLKLINNTDRPSNAHPSVWAPFIVVGEGGVDQSR